VKRQFLRVYIGIVLVLLLAALATLFVVDREVRTVVDRRLEETMEPWIRRFRTHLQRAGEDQAQRTRVLERWNNFDFAPFAVDLVPLTELDLSAGARKRLIDGEIVLVHTGDGRMVYAAFDDDEVMALGPLRGRRFAPRGPGPRWGQPRHPPEVPRWFSPQQGTYFLLGALLVILLLIGTAVYMLLRPFERRIYALADVARQFGEGELKSRAKIGRDDAIGELARTFNSMADRIESFIERQRELVRAVSHEFRTPLARLFFLVDDAQDASSPEEKNRFLGRIDGSLQDLNDLVEELLTFARLERDTEKLARESVDVAAVLADVSAVVSDLRGDLVFETRCEQPEISAVPRLFRRAVLNLVTNAVRHARERIQITCSCEGGTVHLHVDDDGPGIPEEARGRIFEPFFRLDESRSADSGGAGLGLAIVQRIMSLHDGQVRVADSPLGGTRFTLVFPAPSPA